MFPRSSLKPLQAVAMLEGGFVGRGASSGYRGGQATTAKADAYRRRRGPRSPRRSLDESALQSSACAA